MTREETINLLEIMIAAYPRFKVVDAKRMADAYTLAFANDDAGTVYKAARYCMNTSPYFPQISDIRANMGRAFIYDTEEPVKKIDSGKAPEIDVKGIVGCDGHCWECRSDKELCPFANWYDKEDFGLS